MRLTAYYDDNGNIVGLAASPSDDSVPAEVMTATLPGLRSAEVQVPAGVELDFENPQQLNDELGKLVESHQMEAGALTRRS